MSPQFTQVGGLRWGGTYWCGSNVTVPFATLQATSESIRIRVKGFMFRGVDINLQKCRIVQIYPKRHLIPIGVGVVFVHSEQDAPRCVCFWTFAYAELKTNLISLGYHVLDRKNRIEQCDEPK